MFQQFCNERNIKLSTIKSYENAVKSYTSFHEMTLDELLEEAIEEQKNKSIFERQIRTRMMQYRAAYWNSEKHTNKTVEEYLKKMKTIYRHFQIEVPVLPRANQPDEYETNYYDLPSKKHIIEALNIADLNMQAIILFMSSSGTGLSETAEMTVQDFVDGCSEYHNTEGLNNIIEALYRTPEPIVPTLYLKRKKTKKYYYTFCSPEASLKIIEMLRSRKYLSLNDTLFNKTQRQISDAFMRINDTLNYGFKGKYRFFRAHTMRKYHASNIGLSEEHIDLLQGRSRDAMHSTYIKTNPVALKKHYINAMENVMLYTKEEKIERQEFNITINVMLMGSEYGISL